MMGRDGRRTIAEAEGRARRFTDHSVVDAGIRELYAERAVWQRYLDVESALAEAEARFGVIPPAAAERIAEMAQVDALDGRRIEVAMSEQAHPFTPVLDEFVRVVGADAGGWVHWGATTQNIVLSARALILRDSGAVLHTLVLDVLSTLAELAEQTAEVLMAGRTHGQHAVPITFGYKVAEWIDPLIRLDQRATRSLDGCAVTVLGGAVGTFGGFGGHGPAVQAAVAELMGTTPVELPSRAITDRFLAYLSDLALISAHAGRIALEIETLMQTEFAELAEPRMAADVGSSTMPHKRNPKLCADILDLDGELRARVSHAISASVHPHEADGRAEQVLTRALEDGQTLLGDILSRLSIVLDGLEFDADRMQRNLSLSDGMLGAEAVMLGLGERIGRDRAHSIVLHAARTATGGVGFADALGTVPEVADHLGQERLAALLDPRGQLAEAPALARSTATRARDHVADERGVGPTGIEPMTSTV
jgi:adenylosuccinate lyase